MKISIASSYYRPRSQRVKIAETQPLAAQQAAGQSPYQIRSHEPWTVAANALRLGTTLYVPRDLELTPDVGTKQIESPKDTTKENSILATIAKNYTDAAKVSSPAIGVITLGNTMTQPQLAKYLEGVGFTPNAADGLASSGLNVARSNSGKLMCVFLIGSSITLATVEITAPHWEKFRKLTMAGIGGAILVLFAIILMYLGIWGQPAKNDKPEQQTKDTIQKSDTEHRPAGDRQ